MGRWVDGRSWGLVLGLTACGAKSTAPVAAMVQAPEPPVELTLDIGALYGHASASTFMDIRLFEPGLMDRVLVERSLVDPIGEQEQLEGWTRNVLLRYLANKRAVVVAPGVGAAHGWSACAAGDCGQPAPTASLRDVTMVSGTDALRAVVLATDAREVTLRLRVDDDEPSLCGLSWTVPLGYVKLSMLVQRFADGAVVGIIDESKLLAAPRDGLVKLSLPDPGTDAASFCEALADAFETERVLQRTPWMYLQASRLLLESSLGSLMSSVTPSGESEE